MPTYDLRQADKVEYSNLDNEEEFFNQIKTDSVHMPGEGLLKDEEPVRSTLEEHFKHAYIGKIATPENFGPLIGYTGFMYTVMSRNEYARFDLTHTFDFSDRACYWFHNLHKKPSLALAYRAYLEDSYHALPQQKDYILCCFRFGIANLKSKLRRKPP